MSDLLGLPPVALPDELGLPAEDGQQTPTSVRQQLRSLLKRVEALEARLNPNASNSSRPPSTDSEPHTAISKVARTSLGNSIDETSWLMHGDRQWLWGMANQAVAYFQRHTHRSKTALALLIGDWTDILVREGLSYLSRLGRPTVELLSASDPRSPRTGRECRSRYGSLW